MEIINTIIVKWRNGNTAVDIRKVSKGYQVIESCLENKTRDGTGINQTFKNLEEAKAIQIVYADYLKSKQ